MGQEEVITYLKEKRDWATVSEIAEVLGLNRASVLACVNRLMKTDFVVVDYRKDGRHRKYFIKLREE